MRRSSVVLLTIAALTFGLLASCVLPDTLSGTLNVASFFVAAGKTRLVNGDLTIEASQSVDIRGELIADGDAGQSITIRAQGDVMVSGTVMAGNGAPGSPGGDLTIVSSLGDITLAETAAIAAGDGGTGEPVEAAMTILDPEGVEMQGRMLSGGAGASGGSVVLRAPNGRITFDGRAGMIHVGNGGDGLTFEVHGDDLLSTEMAEPLENSGGDSGDLVLEAMNVNGAPLTPGEAPLIDANLFSGGRGGNAGDLFWGTDASGNSTWPDAVSTQKRRDTAEAKPSGFTARKIFNDLLRSGAKGGDGYFSAGAGSSVRITGRSAMAFGADGQNAFAFGGWGGNCKSPACLEGGNGGSADATGGRGGPGRDPNGTAGDGGKGDATGGLGGLGFINNGRHGDASAFGGWGGKGGGTCNSNVVDQGGQGGMGGGAFASAGTARAIARSGNGGDGGDGLNFSGPVGSPGLASAFGGTRTETQGTMGNSGRTCPTSRALSLSTLSKIPLEGGSYIQLSCITGGNVTPSEEGCGCEHLHGSVTVSGIQGGPFEDPNPEGCGHGCIVTVRDNLLDHACTP